MCLDNRGSLDYLTLSEVYRDGWFEFSKVLGDLTSDDEICFFKKHGHFGSCPCLASYRLDESPPVYPSTFSSRACLRFDR